MKFAAFTLFAICAGAFSFAQSHSIAYQEAARKFDYIRENGKRERPNPAPTVFSATELNAWVNQGGIKLPIGVENVRFSSTPGIITALAHINFDRIKSGPASSNPLMQIFSGVHEVKVVARAGASGGTGRVHVISVSIDQVIVPRIALQFFAELYLQPKYGDKAGLDSTFRLPARVDSASAGSDTLTVVQR